MKARIGSFFFVLVVMLSVSAWAQDGEPPDAASAGTIEAAPPTTSDAEIRARILDIFSEIEALKSIQVDVNAGVVSLRGNAPTSEDADRAVALAERLEGAVTVENEIQRSLSVDENLAPALSRFRDSFLGIMRALPLVLVALTIGIAIAVAGYLLSNIRRLWRGVARNDFLADLLATSIRVFFALLGLFIFLDILNASAALGAILGGAGVVGLAVGFALRDIVDNYISSIMLSLRQPFRPFDHVVIGTHEGKVIRLTSRATILMTLNGNHLRVPNATVFKSDILNYSRNPERRFEFELGIDADDDAIAGTAIAVEALQSLSFVLSDPPPSAHIKEVGDSNIVLTVLGWVDQTHTDFIKARSVAIWAAKQRLEQTGFALPEPIYRLRIDSQYALTRSDDLIQDSDTTHEVKSDVAKPPGETPAEPSTDVARETYIERKVAEERQSQQAQEDLLSAQQPVE